MNRQTAFQLLPIVALAATLRFWGLTFGLPNTDARPDEGRIVRTAVTFVLDNTLNPRFFGYPTLFMYSMAGVYAAGCSAGIGRTGSRSRNRRCGSTVFYPLTSPHPR